MVSIVVISLAFTLAVSSNVQVPITRAQAIEISRNSTLVRQGIAIAWQGYAYPTEAHYHNSTEVEQKKKGPSQSLYENVPEGHSVWEIIWSIHTGIGGYLIGVFVDAEIGVIVDEVRGVRFL